MVIFLKHANQSAEPKINRGFGQNSAAAAAAFGFDNSCARKAQHDFAKVVAGQVKFAGQIRRRKCLLRVAGHAHQHTQAIVGERGEAHAEIHWLNRYLQYQLTGLPTGATQIRQDATMADAQNDLPQIPSARPELTRAIRDETGLNPEMSSERAQRFYGKIRAEPVARSLHLAVEDNAGEASHAIPILC